MLPLTFSMKKWPISTKIGFRHPNLLRVTQIFFLTCNLKDVWCGISYVHLLGDIWHQEYLFHTLPIMIGQEVWVKFN